MQFPLYVVDAFSSVPFEGNPAAVVLLEDDTVLDAEMKQKVAREMNLSETAFVSKLRPEDRFHSASSFSLRWFTPTTEVPLCGHATLAASAVIFEVFGNSATELHFKSRSGPLMAKREAGGRISLNFPARRTEEVDMEKYRHLIQAVVGDIPVNDVRYAPEERKLLVRLADNCTRTQLEAFRPCIPKMLGAETNVKGVTVTLKGSAENGCAPYDFISRHFCPWYGIPEDPVTGSAHTVLGPYWSAVLSKTDLYARQASQRGGDLFLTLPQEGNNRIQIGGNATIVVRGELTL